MINSFENISNNNNLDYILGFSNPYNNDSKPERDNSSMPLNSYSPFQSYTSLNFGDNNHNIEDDSNKELKNIENKFRDIIIDFYFI